MCLQPLNAWYNHFPNADTGKLGVHFKPSLLEANRAPNGDISLPCGKCKGCLKDKSNTWVRRMQVELLSNPVASYVTLTYRPSDLPSSPSKYHIQTFLKRLRQAPRDFGVKPFNLRYFIASEHGDKTYRIHYHGILFGVDIMRDPAFKSVCHHFSSKGFPVYTSSVLEKIWSHGFVSVDIANSYSIKYIADYITQSQFDDDFWLHSQGIGVPFFCRYERNERNRLVPSSLRESALQMADLGIIYLPQPRGRDPMRYGLPKYMLRYYEQLSPSLYDRLKQSRRDFAARGNRQSSLSDFADYLKLTSERQLKEKVLHNG